MPTRPFLTIAPGRLEVREGGGCMTIFGMPFLAAGLFLMLGGAGLVPLETGQPPSMRLGFLFFGLPFVLVGGALVFGRSWTTFSATDRTVVKQKGLLVPMQSRSYRVDEYDGVILEFIRGDSDTADQYPVSLKARAGSDMRLFSSTTVRRGAPAGGCDRRAFSLRNRRFLDGPSGQADGGRSGHVVSAPPAPRASAGRTDRAAGLDAQRRSR